MELDRRGVELLFQVLIGPVAKARSEAVTCQSKRSGRLRTSRRGPRRYEPCRAVNAALEGVTLDVRFTFAGMITSVR
jgi:hypothetical protein